MKGCVTVRSGKKLLDFVSFEIISFLFVFGLWLFAIANGRPWVPVDISNLVLRDAGTSLLSQTKFILCLDFELLEPDVTW